MSPWQCIYVWYCNNMNKTCMYLSISCVNSWSDIGIVNCISIDFKSSKLMNPSKCRSNDKNIFFKFRQFILRQPIEGSGYGVKTPLSTIFQIYRCSQFLLVEETRENHWSVTSHWQALSSSVVSSTPRHHSGIFCIAVQSIFV
jgi:hypothetical protein